MHPFARPLFPASAALGDAAGTFVPVDPAHYAHFKGCVEQGGLIDEDDIREALEKGWGCGRLENRADGVYYVLGPNAQKLKPEQAAQIQQRLPAIKACLAAGGFPRAGGQSCYQMSRNEAGVLGFRIDQPIVPGSTTIAPANDQGMSTGAKVALAIAATLAAVVGIATLSK